MKILKKEFGKFQEKESVFEYTLENSQGTKVEILNYGGIIREFWVKNREGELQNVVLGFDTLEKYLDNVSYLGASIGRIAGRVAEARFILDGEVFKLDKNNGENCLHGGELGFHNRIWRVTENLEKDSAQIILELLSPHGEGGFPGNLSVKMIYELNEKNQFTIRYFAESDRKTFANFTNHTYFNFNRDLSSVFNHKLKISADSFAELKDNMIPTGNLLPVEGTSFDFRTGAVIQKNYSNTHPQNILVGNGYDHPFIFGSEKSLELWEEKSGIRMKIETSEPALVFYSGNFLKDNLHSLNGNFTPANYMGLALETQGYPDAINQKDFPKFIITPENPYSSWTTYNFSE
ncbi:MAG: aldose epimerase family protein [Fusobacteriaceae bacterium]